jgi:hypothetical protein
MLTNGIRTTVSQWWLRTTLVAATVAAVSVAAASGTAGRDRVEMLPQSSRTSGATLTLITIAFGPQQVWRPSPTAVDALHQCIDSAECVYTVMDQDGASRDAFEFYHLTGWFLVDLKDTGGPVKLATVANPWRVNENEQPALVGGTPAVVYPEDVAAPVDTDTGFKGLKSEFPLLAFWRQGARLEKSATSDTGQTFVFRYRLLEVHSGPVRGWARIAFDFAPDGTYRRAQLLGIERQ